MSRSRESTIQKKATERRRKAELYSDAAREYLREHNIPTVINAVLERIILEQPDDPLSMLQDELMCYDAQGNRCSHPSPSRSPNRHPTSGRAMAEDDRLVVEEEVEVKPDREMESHALQMTPMEGERSVHEETIVEAASQAELPPKPNSISSSPSSEVKEFVVDVFDVVLSRLEAPRAVSPATTEVGLEIETDDEDHRRE